MKITNIRLHKDDKPEHSRRAFGAITLDKTLVITGVSVFEGKKGHYVRLPQYKKEDGTYKDIVFPTKADLRKEINQQVLAKYEEVCAA